MMRRLIFCVLACATLTLHAHADDLDVALDKLAPGPDRDAILLGRNIVFDTPRYAAKYVSGGISCASCHINGGRQAHASPWYGIVGVMPAYSARSATVASLEQRINECFRRSENGSPLPFGSAEMNGLLAYMSFISKGVPAGEFGPGRGMGKLAGADRPDALHGKTIYGQKCAACHGANGGGLQSNGSYSVPPLWGDASYNIGASMARVGPAAAFIKHNMPLGQGDTLTDQEALDVAYYVTRQPRPDLAGKAADWPNGGKPADARY
ncbi:c-type cytochrome [Paraherbaspirillum soli]|uniref:C-type cytochrome n=1 Tax=Paraherbaspirillum soli TaxID=631222 RepID=A0ABW0MA94_9BURK